MKIQSHYIHVCRLVAAIIIVPWNEAVLQNALDLQLELLNSVPSKEKTRFFFPPPGTGIYTARTICGLLCALSTTYCSTHHRAIHRSEPANVTYTYIRWYYSIMDFTLEGFFTVSGQDHSLGPLKQTWLTMKDFASAMKPRGQQQNRAPSKDLRK